MRLIIILLAALIFPSISNAQKRKKDSGPNEEEKRQVLVADAAVAFSSGDLATAEANYTEALRLWEDRQERYQRALVRVARGDSSGWCEDLSFFRGNDDLQKSLYRTYCQQFDSLTFDASGLSISHFPGVVSVSRRTEKHKNKTVLRLYDVEGKLRAGLTVIATDTLFFHADTLSSFPGGETELFRYLGSNTKYPDPAIENGRSGTVYLQFRVGVDGIISRVEVLRGVYHALDVEAIRVVSSMPSWRPGQWQGRAIPIIYTLPVRFSLR